MVQIHPSVANQQISLNSWFHVFVNYFFLEQNGAWMNFRDFDEFLGLFSQKMLMVRKSFLMVFWSVSKKWIYIIDQEMKSGFWSTGSELFLADRQGEDSLKDSFLMLDDESCFEKDGYQTCPLKSVKISEIRVFPIDCHAALSKTKSQKRVVILREAKRSRRI